MEIAVVGNSEFVLGFRLAGIRKTYAADNDDVYRDLVTRALGDEEIAILVLKGSDLERLPLRMRVTLEESVKPTVITMGAESGGMSMRERIIRAMGVDLWK
ncbi:MAG: V-type ATP synthase subunit F [Methanomicrobiaceae archaeon]|nr:V-type ATP synthase subunit F [Methanomicrobiaceae archaeon]